MKTSEEIGGFIGSGLVGAALLECFKQFNEWRRRAKDSQERATVAAASNELARQQIAGMERKDLENLAVSMLGELRADITSLREEREALKRELAALRTEYDQTKTEYEERDMAQQSRYEELQTRYVRLEKDYTQLRDLMGMKTGVDIAEAITEAQRTTP